MNFAASDVKIRQFNDADAVGLTDLLHEAYAELGNQGLNYTAVDQSVETTRERASGGQCWIVEARETIVGTLTMSYPPAEGIRELTPEARQPKRAWLNQVAVSPRIQRSGIAGRLWELGKDWAHRQGATAIGVDTAQPATHLVRLYVSWGFEHRGVVHWPGKTYDSVVMVRPGPG